MLTITPVVEVPWIEKGESWPWPVSADGPFAFEPLDASRTESAGTFMASLFGYYGKDHERSVDGLLKALRECDDLLAPGGMMVTDGEKAVRPGCCCGLESWTEWRLFLETGGSPWLGHDPWPRLVSTGERIHLWPHVEHDADDPPVEEAITVSRQEFEAALTNAETQIKNFFAALPQWFDAVRADNAADVIEKILTSFHIAGDAPPDGA